MADGKTPIHPAPVLYQQPFPAILPAPVPSSSVIDDDKEVMSADGLNAEVGCFYQQARQSLNLPSVPAIPPAMVAASLPANAPPSSGRNDVIFIDDDDVMPIIVSNEPTLNQPSVVRALPSVVPSSSGIDANEAQPSSIDQSNEVGHTNQILSILLRQQPPLLAILPAPTRPAPTPPASPAPIQVDDDEDLPNVGLNLEIAHSNNDIGTVFHEPSVPNILPAVAIPSSSGIDDQDLSQQMEDLPAAGLNLAIRPANFGQNINNAIVRTPVIRQQPACPSSSSSASSARRPSTLSYLRGDIDDEEFDNHFRNESQWQKDYGTSSYDDVMCTIQEQPVVVRCSNILIQVCSLYPNYVLFSSCYNL